MIDEDTLFLAFKVTATITILETTRAELIEKTFPSMHMSNAFSILG